MNAGPDVERRISDYLAEQTPTQAPDRILPATFERTRHARQRRFGAAWRSISMNRTWQLATAAVVGVLIIGAGAVWIGGSNGIGTPATTPSPTPKPSLLPSSSPVAGPTAASATDNPGSVSSYRIARDNICRREAAVIRGSDDKSGLNAKLDGLFDSALTDAQRAPKIAALTAVGDELDKQHDQLATLEVPSDAPRLAADHAASLADYQQIIDTLTQLRTALVEGRLQDAQALDASSNPISGRIQRFENKYTLFDCG